MISAVPLGTRCSNDIPLRTRSRISDEETPSGHPRK